MCRMEMRGVNSSLRSWPEELLAPLPWAEVLSLGGEDQANSTNCEVVVNEGATAFVDFRVESDNMTHCLFVDAGTDAVSIGDSTNAPGGVLEISQNSQASLPGLLLATADVDQVALDINASQTTANVLDITANGLTSGDAISVASSTTDTTARALLKLSNSNSAAVCDNTGRNRPGRFCKWGYNQRCYWWKWFCVCTKGA